MLQVPFFSCLGTPHPFLLPAFLAVAPRGEGRPAWPEFIQIHPACYGLSLWSGLYFMWLCVGCWGGGTQAPLLLTGVVCLIKSHRSSRHRLSGLCRCSAAKTWSRLVPLSRVLWAHGAALRGLRNLCAWGITAPFPSRKIPVPWCRCSYSCFEEAGVGPVRLRFLSKLFVGRHSSFLLALLF